MAADTGWSDADGITRDPTLVGTVDDPSPITQFAISVDGGGAIDILAELDNGAFILTAAELDVLAGGRLEDGVHTLSFTAGDAGGLASGTLDVLFTLDTVRPPRPDTPDLLPESDSGRLANDNITNLSPVNLRVDGEAGSLLRLFVEGVEVAQGTPGGGPLDYAVALIGEGDQRISTSVEDAAGNVSLFSNLLLVTLDTTPPVVPVFTLDASSDTRPFGDGETALEFVRLVGTAEPGSELELLQTAALGTADSDAAFAFKGIALGGLGEHQFSVASSDAAGNTSQGDATVKRVDFAAGDLTRPEVSLTVSSTANVVGDSVTLTVTTADNVGVTATQLRVGQSILGLDAQGSATFLATEPGEFTAVATAWDAVGNEGQASVDFVFFFDPVASGDTTPPVAAFDNPGVTAIAILPGNIIGTATDDNFLRYTLELSARGQDAFAEFAVAEQQVSDGILGIFDPTILENGYYDVRLTAFDKSGNRASASQTFKADGQAKLGNFTVTFVDAGLSAAGLPIQATRTYDTRNALSSGDFGYGWSLTVDDIKVTQANVLGDGGFEQTVEQVQAGVWNVGFRNTKDVTVSVTLPDGQVESFIMGYVGWLTTQADPAPLAYTQLFFERQPGSGTTSLLEALADNIVEVRPAAYGAVTFHDRTTGELYDPQRWKLTTPDGSVFVIDEVDGMESITDPNGNSLTYDPTGITHSDGTGLRIARDTQERITSLEDPAGETVLYEYDFYGDLVTVTDQLGNVTTFVYDNHHRLLEIHDPLGRRGIRHEYDETGRLVATIDASGHRIDYESDPDNRQEVINDRAGNRFVYEYDANGNIVKETDPLSNSLWRTFDSNG
ncbi:RHS repeat protein, partial [bacterium]|nr:RHS repeat protein [bacterium]